MALLTMENLSFLYPDARAYALKDIGFSVERGEFITLCGASGSGKSTFLRLLKPLIRPGGQLTGRVLLDGEPVETFSRRAQAERIGFIMQDPDSQLVTDRVFHELAFGLESIGADRQLIRRRISEMALFFGIEELFERKIDTLSGGQKQIVNLASVMVMQPDLLLLDEPASMLDPVASENFLNALVRVNREIGTTVILAEHHLDEVMSVSSRVVALEGGHLLCDSAPEKAASLIRENALYLSLPSATRVYTAVMGFQDPSPVSVLDGRAWLDEYLQSHTAAPVPVRETNANAQPSVSAKDLWFRFDKDGPDILKGLDFEARPGEITAILGGNGTGKSTLLSLLCGLKKTTRGKITITGRAYLLPQDPKLLFAEKTLHDEMARVCADESRVTDVAAQCALTRLLNRHPYDLSGGEMQRAAMAIMLLKDPDILLLDEPTKGLDAVCARALAKTLKALAAQGKTVILVSHDVEFCAQHADVCHMMFDGVMTAQGEARAFFGGNRFFTTAVNRMTRGYVDRCVTADELTRALGARPLCPQPAPPEDAPPEFPAASPPEEPGKTQRPVSARGAARLLPFFVIPTALVIAYLGFRGGQYYLSSLFILLMCMLPFVVSFERRRPEAREVAVIAVMCALGVAGRAAFFMLPGFKPIVAIVVIAGAALGARTGFLVGAMTMFVSNFFFGQGPWTPWQMFALGLIGLLSGLIFRKNERARRAKPAVCLFGALTAIVVYGGIVNAANVLLYQNALHPKMLIAAYATGFPMDAILAFATFLFLYFMANPFFDKLERLTKRYDMRAFEI